LTPRNAELSIEDPPGESPHTYVDNEETLVQMAKELAAVSHVAVDVEHHHVHSFSGETCLVQFSHRARDWLVDVRVLRDKVMHGADHDVLWLQRDYNIQIVNLFDTGQAMRALGYSRHSLAFLLLHHLDLDISEDKATFQCTDWRVRPLSQELTRYARDDTHYLLYLYDLLHNEAVEAGCLHRIQEQSTKVAQLRYSAPIFSGSAAISEFEDLRRGDPYKSRGTKGQSPPPVPQQRQCFIQLSKWRFEVAREVDESLEEVAPGAKLYQLAKGMFTTREVVEQRCSKQALVLARIDQVLDVISKVKTSEDVADKELDPVRLSQRLKQIAIGKATEGYITYLRRVPREERKAEHPGTPDHTGIFSKSQWDRTVQNWRRALHMFDP